MDENQKFPSLWKMVKTFSSEVAKHIADGGKNVSTAEYERRLKTCSTCPFFKAEKDRCGSCGCLVEHKAKWRSSSCPEKKWNLQITGYGKIEEGDNPDSSDEV